MKGLQWNGKNTQIIVFEREDTKTCARMVSDEVLEQGIMIMLCILIVCLVRICKNLVFYLSQDLTHIFLHCCRHDLLGTVIKSSCFQRKHYITIVKFVFKSCNMPGSFKENGEFVEIMMMMNNFFRQPVDHQRVGETKPPALPT